VLWFQKYELVPNCFVACKTISNAPVQRRHHNCVRPGNSVRKSAPTTTQKNPAGIALEMHFLDVGTEKNDMTSRFFEFFSIFSTLTISGFDLGELWSNSKSVSPPNHLNLMSVSGLAALVKRCGLELVDLSTPGMLDVDILRNMLEENSEISISRFARQISQANETVQEKFQNFLQENRLSSHVVVVARKIESLGADSVL